MYCSGCTAYIATKEDPGRLNNIANRMGQSIDDAKCEGCRSNVLSAAYCRTCKMKKCAIEREVDFCVQCKKYPCEEIINFQKQRPHRSELFESLAYLKENGLEKWYEKMNEDYSGNACGEINSAYDLKCRKCGTTPGNNFVERNKEAIVKVLSER